MVPDCAVQQFQSNISQSKSYVREVSYNYPITRSSCLFLLSKHQEQAFCKSQDLQHHAPPLRASSLSMLLSPHSSLLCLHVSSLADAWLSAGKELLVELKNLRFFSTSPNLHLEHVVPDTLQEMNEAPPTPGKTEFFSPGTQHQKQDSACHQSSQQRWQPMETATSTHQAH